MQVLTRGQFFSPVHNILGHVLKTWWTQFNKWSENKVSWVGFLVPLILDHARGAPLLVRKNAHLCILGKIDAEKWP